MKAAIRRLEDKGLLVVERGKGGETNHYRLGGSDIDPGQTLTRVKKRTRCGSATGPKLTHRTNPPSSRRESAQDVLWSEEEQRFIVTAEQVARWKRDFSTVDVETEIAKAGAWHAANRRWRSRYHAALTRWLSRAGISPIKGSGFTPAKTPISYANIGTRHD